MKHAHRGASPDESDAWIVRVCKQIGGGAIGFYDAKFFGVHNHHGVGGDLKKLAIARFVLSKLPVVLLHLALGDEKALLDRSHRAQVAPHREHRPVWPKLDRGIGNWYVLAPRSGMKNLSPTRDANGLRFSQQFANLCTSPAASGFDPWTTDPLRVRAGDRIRPECHVLNHAVVVDDERDIARDGDKRLRQLRGEFGQIRQASGVGRVRQTENVVAHERARRLR
jgi:hypothetical protein